jgi:hypothetical protein
MKVLNTPISFMAVVRPACSESIEHSVVIALQRTQTSILKQWSIFGKRQISGVCLRNGRFSDSLVLA